MSLTSVLTDTGYFSKTNVQACVRHQIEPLLAMKRESHHPPPCERFAPDTAEPHTDDPVMRMAHRLTTQAGRTGVWYHQTDDGFSQILAAWLEKSGR